MTPLRPIANTTRVRGVASKRFPLNAVCAHPECDRTDVTAHHIFGRPRGPDSDSWFVEVEVHGKDNPEVGPMLEVIPHVSGLCGHGTEGHHGDVEVHSAWIRYEDGEFVWYDRGEQELIPDWDNPQVELAEYFQRLGPLNPQPGSREGKPKRRRAKKGTAKMQAVWSVKVPKDEREDGHEVLTQGFEDAKAIVGAAGSDTSRSNYFVLADIFEFVRQHRGS